MIISRRARGLELLKLQNEFTYRHLLYEENYIADPDDPEDDDYENDIILYVKNNLISPKLAVLVDHTDSTKTINTIAQVGTLGGLPLYDYTDIEGSYNDNDILEYEEIDYCIDTAKTYNICLCKTYDTDYNLHFVDDWQYRYGYFAFDPKPLSPRWGWVNEGYWQDDTTRTDKGYSVLVYEGKNLFQEIELETLSDYSEPTRICGTRDIVVILDPTATKKVKVIQFDDTSWTLLYEFGEIRTNFVDPEIEKFENPTSVATNGSSVFILDEWYDPDNSVTKYFVKKYSLEGTYITRTQILEAGIDIYLNK